MKKHILLLSLLVATVFAACNTAKKSTEEITPVENKKLYSPM